MATPDFFGIKERIVAILQDDAIIYSATPSDKTTLRKIEAGAPSPKAIDEPPLPRCWVTNDQLMANVTPLASVQSNTSLGEDYDYRINVIFVVEAKDGPKTEEDIDDFTQNIITQIETNYDLRAVGGAESTRLADETRVVQITELPSMFKGDRVKGRVIKFRVRVAS